MEHSIVEITTYLYNFITDFEKKYKKKLKVTILDVNEDNVIDDKSDIKVLEDIVVETMHKRYPELSYIKDLTVKVRRREIIMWVQAYSHLAYLLGFTKTYIGKSIDKNHATVIHSIKTSENLLSIEEKQFTEVYNLILKSIQKYVGIISTDPSEKFDTKSVLNALRNKQKNKIIIG